MLPEKVQHKLNNDLWITSGIFSSRYLLERLSQAGEKLWPLDKDVYLLLSHCSRC